MERLSRLNERMAELFDLPAELVAGLFHLQLLGGREVLLEGHGGIVSYAEDCIDVSVRGGILRLRGKDLSLRAMTGEELRIAGRIDAVEFLR